MSGTKDDGKPTLAPSLRFPLFLDGPIWEMKKIGSLLVETPRPIELEDERDYCLVTVRRRYGGLVSRGILKGKEIKVNSQFLVNTNDFLISKRQIVHNACGLVTQSLNGSVVSNEYSVLTAKTGCSIEFINWFAQQPCVSASFLECSVGIVIEKMLFKLDVWLKREFLFPSFEEQQKIAECLSSVDELIAAQARKVDALKTHKKGLMQQLFPREGETQPRLRFPEFQDAGEWASEELSSCLEKVIDYRGKAPPKAESGVPLITAKNVRLGWLDMTNDEYIEADAYEEWMSKGIPKAGDILFTTEAPLGNVALFPSTGKFALGQRIITLRCITKKCVPEFLFQSLLSPQMQGEIDFHSTGSTAKGIKSAVFVTLDFCYPAVREQQRIADCLTSLDDLITAQAQKLEALKTHKKGLMQQLFPSSQATEA